MFRVENVATPATALTHVVPPSVAPDDPVPLVIARHTLPLNVAATLPMWSRPATPREDSVAPATALGGGVLTRGPAGGPEPRANGPLGPPVGLPLVTRKVNASPPLSMEGLVKLATPPTAVIMLL